MNKARIMIVDDDETISNYLKALVPKLGYEVIGSASTARDAMAMVESLTPDIVLMDVDLGLGMNGIQVGSHLKYQFGIPAIYITAGVDADQFQQIRVTEPLGFIFKPINRDQLSLILDLALYRLHIERSSFSRVQFLESIMDELTMAIVVTDDKESILQVNSKFEAMTGLKRQDIYGSLFADVIKMTADASAAGKFIIEAGGISRGVRVAKKIMPTSDFQTACTIFEIYEL